MPFLSVSTGSCSQDKAINTDTSYLESKLRRNMIHACHSIILIIALVYSAVSVDAFSSNPRYFETSAITTRYIPTQIPTSLKRPAFIFNQRLDFPSSTIYTGNQPTHTLLFATQKETKPSSNKQSLSADAQEWNALLSAFQMYKAAYGDLKVPSRFVVPSMPPWPGKSKLCK